MFSPGLVNNLDNLAREGVVDFDATAFVTGTNPRYVGNPSYAQLPLPDMSGVDTGNLKQPSKDEMIYSDAVKDGSVSKNPLWKKVLFGLLAVGLIAGGVLKFKKGINLKNLIPNTSGWFKNAGNSIKNGFSNLCQKAGKIFKK